MNTNNNKNNNYNENNILMHCFIITNNFSDTNRGLVLNCTRLFNEMNFDGIC